MMNSRESSLMGPRKLRGIRLILLKMISWLGILRIRSRLSMADFMTRMKIWRICRSFMSHSGRKSMICPSRIFTGWWLSWKQEVTSDLRRASQLISGLAPALTLLGQGLTQSKWSSSALMESTSRGWPGFTIGISEIDLKRSWNSLLT